MGISVGDTVAWTWGQGTATGQVIERFTGVVTCTIKGTDVTRNASEDLPAFLIEQEEGGTVLKSVTELQQR